MATEVFIEIKGLDTPLRRLQAIKRLPENVLPSAIDESMGIILNRIRARFIAEIDPEGNQWVRSKAAEAREAAGLSGLGGGTLFDTGKLFRSLKKVSSGKLRRKVITRIPYASQHNFGTNGQVKRTFLGFSAGDIVVLERVVFARIHSTVINTNFGL